MTSRSLDSCSIFALMGQLITSRVNDESSAESQSMFPSSPICFFKIAFHESATLLHHIVPIWPCREAAETISNCYDAGLPNCASTSNQRFSLVKTNIETKVNFDCFSFVRTIIDCYAILLLLKAYKFGQKAVVFLPSRLCSSAATLVESEPNSRRSCGVSAE
jgi:hypothetical protein